jgi:hypothetical protein
MSESYAHMKHAFGSPNSETPKIIPTRGAHGWSHPRPPEDNPRPIQHNRRVSRDAQGLPITARYDNPDARRRNRVSMPASYAYPARSLRQAYEAIYGSDLASKLIANADAYQDKHKHYIDGLDFLRETIPQYNRAAVERKIPYQAYTPNPPSIENPENNGTSPTTVAFYNPNTDSINVNTAAIPFNMAVYPDRELVDPIAKDSNTLRQLAEIQKIMLHEGIHGAQSYGTPYHGFFRPIDAPADFNAQYKPFNPTYVNNNNQIKPFQYSRFAIETPTMVAEAKVDYYRQVVNPRNGAEFDEELMNFNNPESYQKFLNWAANNSEISWMLNPKELPVEYRDLMFRGVAQNSENMNLNPTMAGSLDSKMAADGAIFEESKELAKSIVNPTSEESLFRDAYYDLKRQHLGPSFANTQRVYEIGDSLLYQSLYGVPSAVLGGALGGPAGALVGLGVGGKAGTIHAAVQELERLKAAKREFNKNEKQLLNRLSDSFKNWGTVSAVLGGIGGAGVGYGLAPEEGYQKYLAAILAGLGGAAGLGYLGGLTGRGLERERLRSSEKYRKLIEHYD